MPGILMTEFNTVIAIHSKTGISMPEPHDKNDTDSDIDPDPENYDLCTTNGQLTNRVTPMRVEGRFYI
jgi:hypothetical protein